MEGDVTAFRAAVAGYERHHQVQLLGRSAGRMTLRHAAIAVATKGHA